MKHTLTLITALLLAPLTALHAADKSPSPDKTGVTFRTADDRLQRLFEAAEAQAAANLKPFSPPMTILVEGAEQLYAVLEKHDQYLWKVRDSNRDGCLEAWSAGDTGEGRFATSIGDKDVFSCTRGVRVVTDLAGNVREVVGIAPEPQSVVLQIAGVRHELIVKPNQVWRPDAAKPTLFRAAPFDYPYQENIR